MLMTMIKKIKEVYNTLYNNTIKKLSRRRDICAFVVFLLSTGFSHNKYSLC